jgi:Hypoxia induced protein conserved region
LIPIGCATTAYFLASGIRAFQKRDPVRSQRMMRNRIAAQFVTLVCFIGYIGVDRVDFRFAPMYQDKLKAQQQEQAAAEAAAASTTADKD